MDKRGPHLKVTFIVSLFFIFTTVFNGNALANEKIVLELRWYHGFQFAGYYAALEKGFYREKGLDVEICEGGPFNIADVVISGEAHYGVASSELVMDEPIPGEICR